MSASRIYKPDAVKLAESIAALDAKSELAEAQFRPGPFPIDALNETQRRIVEAVAEVTGLDVATSTSRLASRHCCSASLLCSKRC